MKLSNERLMQLQKCEEALGFFFKDKSLLDLALTHSSYAHEKYGDLGLCNERLEFFGDSILSFIVTSFLYKNYEKKEGDLSELRAKLVCESGLYMIAERYGLEKYIKTGGAVTLTDGRLPKAIVADSVEAFIAALYIDSGIEDANKFVQREVDYLIFECNCFAKSVKSPKSLLQEFCQKKYKTCPEYKLEKRIKIESENREKFFVDVYLGDRKLSSGEGYSLKEAETDAAAKAYALFGKENGK